MSLTSALIQAYLYERSSFSQQQMFYYLRGILHGYCIANNLNEYAVLPEYLDGIRRMCAKLPE